MAFGGGSGSAQELAITVTLDAASAVSGLGNVDGKLKDIEKSANSTKAAVTKLESGLKLESFAKYAGLAGAGAATMAAGLALATPKLAIMGAQAANAEEAFSRLAKQVGVSATELQRNFNTALASTVPQMEQFQIMSKMLASGIDPSKFTLIAEGARALAKAFGADATDGINRMFQALAGGDTESLKYLGIVVKAEAANRKWAEANRQVGETVQQTVSRMTPQAKLLAVQEEIFAQLQSRMEALGPPTLDAGEAFSQVSVAIKDSTKDFSEAFGKNEALRDAFSRFSQEIRNIPWKEFGDGCASMITGLDRAITYLAEGVQMLPEFANEAQRAAERMKISWEDLLPFGAGNVVKALRGAQATTAPTGGAQVQVIEQQNQALQTQSDIVADILGGQTQSLQCLGTIQKSMEGLLDPPKKLKGHISDAQREAEKLAREFANFDRELRGTNGPLGEFEEAIRAAFNDNTIQSTEAFYAAIDQIGLRAQAAKIPLSDILDLYKKIREEGTSGGAEYGPASGDALDFFKQKSGMSSIGQWLADEFETQTTEGLGQISAFENIGGEIANQLFNGISSGMNGADWASLAGDIGATIGGALGSEFGPIGSAVGSLLGDTIIGGIADMLVGEDSEGTKARKAADKYFADIFNANRLAIVVNGQLKELNDLVFQGNTIFGGAVNFHNGPANDYLNSLTTDAQAAFKGVGAAFEQLLGLSEDFDGYLAGALANNLGNLNNLQQALEATGKSLDEMGQAAIDAFLNMKMTAEEAYSALAAIQSTMEVGIPGAIGAVDVAWENWHAAGWSGGRALLDGLRDVGAELLELGVNTIPGMANTLVNRFGFAATEVQAFMEAMKNAGINSVNDLAKVTNEQLITMANNLQKFSETGVVGTDQATNTTGTTTQPTYSRPSYSSGTRTSGQTAAEKAAEKHKQAMQELANATVQNLKNSTEYDVIVEKLTNHQISAAEAQKELTKQYEIVRKATKNLQEAEDERDKAILAHKKNIGKYIEAVTEAQLALDNLTKKAETGSFNQELLDFMQKFQGQTELIAIAANLAGASFEKMKENAMQGFLSGAETATEAQKRLQDVGPGVAGQTGAVGEEVRRMLQYGTHGGIMTANALRGLAQETKELGGTTLDNLMEAMRGQGVDEDVAAKIMSSLKNAGIESLDALLNASNETAIKVLAQMEDVGVPLENTSQNIRDIAKELAEIPDSKQITIELSDIKISDQNKAILKALGLWPFDDTSASTSTSEPTATWSTGSKMASKSPGLKSKNTKIRLQVSPGA